MVIQSIKTLSIRMVGVVTLFGFTLFLTRNYDPKIIGEYDLIRTFLLVVGSIALLGTDISILYFTGIINSKGNIQELRKLYKKIVTLIFFDVHRLFSAVAFNWETTYWHVF